MTVFIKRIKSALTNLKRADEAQWQIALPEEKYCETALKYKDKAMITIAELKIGLKSRFKRAAVVNGTHLDDVILVSTQKEKSEFCGIKLKPFELKKLNEKIKN